MKAENSGIYAIRHKETGKQYIGSATYFANRWAVHRYHLTRNQHHCSYLQHAWNKYGADSFEWVKLEIVTDLTKLVEREQVWLDACSGLYNLCPTAGSQLGRTHSQETKDRISQVKKGVSTAPPSDEAIAKRKHSLVNYHRVRRGWPPLPYTPDA